MSDYIGRHRRETDDERVARHREDLRVEEHAVLTTVSPDAARSLNHALGRAVVQLGNEVTVYLFGGPQGRAAVDAEWARRERAARERQQR